MDDEAVMPADEKLPYREWIDMPCPVQGHHHTGPTAQCRRTMARLEELGEGAHLCHGCKAPVASRSVCARCGRDHAPKPEKPALSFRSLPTPDRVADGRGCVERVSAAERIWMDR